MQVETTSFVIEDDLFNKIYHNRDYNKTKFCILLALFNSTCNAGKNAIGFSLLSCNVEHFDFISLQATIMIWIDRFSNHTLMTGCPISRQHNTLTLTLYSS